MVVDAVVVNSHHRWSLIVWGGLEIPICISVSLENAEKGRMAIAKYNSLRAEFYHEPLDGLFDNITRAVLD